MIRVHSDSVRLVREEMLLKITALVLISFSIPSSFLSAGCFQDIVFNSSTHSPCVHSVEFPQCSLHSFDLLKTSQKVDWLC